MKVLRYFILVFLCVCGVAANAVTRIGQVRFEGNDVTQDVILRHELYCHEGDIFTEQCVADSAQAIMDTGLFKHVHYYLSTDNVMDVEETDSVVDIVYQVEEKYYLIVLPRYRVKDNEQHIGIQLRWDNIYGMNQNIRMVLEDRGTTMGVNEQRRQVDYTVPNVGDTKFSLDLRYVDINEVDESDPGFEVNRIDNEYGLFTTKWLNPHGRHNGWYAGAGITVQYRQNDMIDPLQLDTTMNALILGLSYGFSDVHDYGYNRGGKEYGYNVDIAHHWMDSESEFSKHTLYYRSYYRFPSVPMDNLNVQTILGHSTNDILGDEAFSLGGEDLRGYEGSRFVGNAMLQVNMEYQTPDDDYPYVRYVVFWDLGKTYEDVEEVVRGGLKSGVGLGIRWKIPAFVRLDLRLDVGYGVSDKDYRVIAGTHYSF